MVMMGAGAPRAEWRVNLGEAEFPQGGFTPPEDLKSKGPIKIK